MSDRGTLHTEPQNTFVWPATRAGRENRASLSVRLCWLEPPPTHQSAKYTNVPHRIDGASLPLVLEEDPSRRPKDSTPARLAWPGLPGAHQSLPAAPFIPLIPGAVNFPGPRGAYALSYQRAVRMSASPCPPPPHKAIPAVPVPRRKSSCAACTVSLFPEAPRG